ncbi:NADPH-dependent FMN reductase [Amycolatopsis sp. cmx-11-51]|uniref:NADPH-dependent FMN reductase n=1 Tax=Amycolatopsis sp. cmx-11-51 TaxID=2785797 RepID=UPI0039E6E3A4
MTTVAQTGTSAAPDRFRLLVITASVRDSQFGLVVAKWFTRRAGAHARFAVDTVDLVATPVPASLARDATVDAFATRVGVAEAVVVVTPEYNHGYPGAPKNALGARREWAAEPIAFVSYGGLAGGLRSVELLRLVVAELHMVSHPGDGQLPLLPPAVRRRRQPEGPGGGRRRPAARPTRLVADALRTARATVPYPA